MTAQPDTLYDLGESFVEWVRETTDLTAKIGSGSDARISPGFLVQDSQMPALTYEVISTVPAHYVDGTSGHAESRLRVRSYGRNRRQAVELSEAVRLRLAPRTGNRTQWGDLFINCVTIESGPFDEQQAPLDGSDRWRDIVVVDYRVSWRQPPY